MDTRSEWQDSLHNGSSEIDYEKIATGLGWFSLALGVTEMAAPGAIARFVGVKDKRNNRALLRSPLYGMREVAAGAGLLTQRKPAIWMWGRVAGDVLDLSSLAGALKSRENDRGRLVGAILAVAGVTALDVLCAQQLTGQERDGRATRAERPSRSLNTIWVNKSPEEVYEFWRNFENLPRFMEHLESVRSLGNGRSQWVAVGPFGTTFDWEAEIVREVPNQMIAWRAVEGSDVQNAGAVFFEEAPGDRGTIIRVELSYDQPAGSVGAGVAKIFGKEPSQMIYDDLRAFKQVIETGEVIRSDASIHRVMHPAQPAGERRRKAS